jgi:hypothetical protein
MLGNDIVDLADAETRGLHPRWDERVLAPAERLALANHPEPHRLRWILWSAKEAAYKAASRLRETVFSPSRFVVTLDAADSVGRVRHGPESFGLAIRRGADFLHARAWSITVATPALVWASRRLRPDERDPGAAARALAVSRLAEVLGIADDQLSILRERRMPALVIAGRHSDSVLSLSHHGRYVGFACRLAAGQR